MRYTIYNLSRLSVAALLIMWTSGCERDLSGLDQPTNPAIPEVFIDAFSGGLQYAAFGGSVVTAFDVDNTIYYSGGASMRIAVPDVGDPRGSYAGGVYFTSGPRDLSQFTALTFWARASQPITLDVVGLGNDLDINRFDASINGYQVNSNWNKYIIPIPDPSRLTAERGMFYFAEGPENERGFTLWFDEVKYEALGTLSEPRARIFDGVDVIREAENGDEFTIPAIVTFNLPNGQDQDVNASAAYFSFESSDPSVATVDESGVVQVLGSGTATITARLGDVPAVGSVTVTSTGAAVRPATPAPAPVQEAGDVISIYSDAYDDVIVDFYNGFWEFSSTLDDRFMIGTDEMIRYNMLNFVGIQFTQPTIDVTDMTHFHIDIWTPEDTALPNTFKVLLVDLGPDGTFDGGDNTSHELTFTAPTLQSEQWVSLDIPLSDFTGLTTRSNLAQIVLSGELSTVYVDNMYFYRGEVTGGGPTEPVMAAPTPDRPESDVISLFSDAYTDVAVDTWRTEWSQAVLTDLDIAGNATKRYTALDFVGVETVATTVDAAEMTHIHVDVWSPDFSYFALKLVDFGADGAFDGGDDVEHEVQYTSPPRGEWISYDIPLTDFVDLTTRSNLAQYIFVGQPTGGSTVYIDNVYFYKQ